MSIRKLIRFTTKTGIGGGTLYYYHELGLWKNTDETLKNFEILRSDVNLFLESSPALVDYLKCAGKSTKESINSVTQPISDFRKEWLDFDLSWVTEGSAVKTGWNKGVGLVVDVTAASPETIKSWSVGGWNKIKETVVPDTPDSSQNANSQPTST